VDGPTDGPSPAWLPAGMRPYRQGAAGDVAVRTWTDGRAWIKVRSTRSWPGARLFGDLGIAVRPVGRAYVSEDGTRVAVHGDSIDVVVTGSVESAVLRRVAASLGVVGRPVPADWAEAATVTLATAERRVAGLLVLPAAAGFSPPAVRADGQAVVLVYAGPGERGVVLATRDGTALTPPLDPDATGVIVRRRTGRWSPRRGELEWVEGGRRWSLRSTTVGLAELVGLADDLEPGR
jgi:hypothetical protein